MAWLVYVLLDDIASLTGQTCLVVGGALALVAMWHRWRPDPEPSVRDETTPKLRVRSWQHHVAGVLFGTPLLAIDSVQRLQGHEVGARPWWAGVIEAITWSAIVAYTLVDLYQHRDARAEQRKEEWAPWG
ncbi:hypothetical protein ASE12_11225 [Aeromicrobium sp. Root236]|nr:hypothetical protein ASE12_11225 [Aeromicrobium sp. Root236]